MAKSSRGRVRARSIERPDALVYCVSEGEFGDKHEAALFARNGETVRVSRAQGRFLGLIAAGWGRPIGLEELLELAYGDREDGGPSYGATFVSTSLCHIRKLLKPLGLAIETRWGVGWTIVCVD